MVIVNDAREYPPGVPSWIDVSTPHPYDAMEFYGTLFGWRFHDAVPPGAPGAYLVATLDGHDVAAISPTDELDSAVWHSYIAARSADTAVEAVIAAGGAVRTSPVDAGPGGRWAEFADPDGAVFRLWQARSVPRCAVRQRAGRLELQRAALAAAREHPSGSTRRCSAGRSMPQLGAGMMRQPGYGDHLARTRSDPDIHERQAFAPEGFADVIAGARAGRRRRRAGRCASRWPIVSRDRHGSRVAAGGP